MGAAPFLTIRKSMRISADRGPPDCHFHIGNHTEAPIEGKDGLIVRTFGHRLIDMQVEQSC
jgi:hypothetical protein